MVNSLAPNTEPCGTPDVTAVFVKGSLQHKPGCFSVQCTTETI